MKYCEKCGKELMDEAVVCPSCGCAVAKREQAEDSSEVRKPAGAASVVLGIIGIVGAFIFALVGHVCSILSIIFGILDCTKKKKPTGLILGIIGEVLSILSSVIGAVIGAAIFG